MVVGVEVLGFMEMVGVYLGYLIVILCSRVRCSLLVVVGVVVMW